MNKILFILLALVSIVTSASCTYAAQSRLIEKRNEYGGETEEESYSIEDDKYRNGLAKVVQYFDSNDRIIKLESYFNEDHILVDGVQQSVQYFDNKFYRTGIRTRVEFIYTDSYAACEGLARAVQYYDEDEKRIRIEYFYTDTYAKKRQVAKLEVQYDPKGNIVKRTYTDKDRNVLAVQEKKQR